MSAMVSRSVNSDLGPSCISKGGDVADDLVVRPYDTSSKAVKRGSLLLKHEGGDSAPSN